MSNPPAPENFDVPDVMDETDAASIFQMQENASALEACRAKLVAETHPDFDGTHCVQCGNVIPKPRPRMGLVHLVEVQRALEVKNKQNTA